MFEFILGLIIGGFLGIFAMCLCVICRVRKGVASREALLAACKRLKRYNEASEALRLNPETAGDYWASVMEDIEFAIEQAEQA